MIDPRRWILVEAWLALGLRVQWAPYYSQSEIPRDDWQEDDETGARYYYDGFGVWHVLDDRRYTGAARSLAPRLGVETMRHELAHYLTASEDRRNQRNFGLPGTDADLDEARALMAERVIDAILAGATHIAELALTTTGKERS